MIESMIQKTITYACHACGSTNIIKNGSNKCNNAQYHCKDCGLYRVLEPKCAYSENEKKTILKTYQKRASMRGLERIFEVARQTVAKLKRIIIIETLMNDKRFLLRESAEGLMAVKNKLFQMVILCLGIVVVLSCTLISGPEGEQPDSSAIETEVAFGIMSTSLANQRMTLEAMQAQMTQQVPAVQPTQTSEPLQPPTQNIQPSPEPSKTDAPPPAELVLDIQTSVDTFYCYESPYELTITVTVSDINRGMAVYYHIEDKNTGATSDEQVIDLHRKTSDTRDATVIGGGSSEQNLQFPPMMGESYFVYQIISDDRSYRSPVYSDITFFPCGQ
jgi:transposase-like protein